MAKDLKKGIALMGPLLLGSIIISRLKEELVRGNEEIAKEAPAMIDTYHRMAEEYETAMGHPIIDVDDSFELFGFCYDGTRHCVVLREEGERAEFRRLKNSFTENACGIDEFEKAYLLKLMAEKNWCKVIAGSAA